LRILKIFDGDYPWDVRVEKVVDSLLNAGHEVRILCRNREGRPRWEIGPLGLEIARLPASPAPLSFPFFFNPVWVAFCCSQLRKYRPERILVRDLPLAPLALWLGRRAGIPVIGDLAEPYPDSIRSQRQFQDLSLIDRLLRNPAAADLVERYTVRRLERALVVCVEAGHRLEQQGLPADHWVEVGNTPRLDAFVPKGSPVPEFDGLEGRLLLLFSGLLAGDRGLEVAIDALGQLESRDPGRYAFVIVGEGPVRERLEAQAAELGLSGQVRFPGFVGHDRLPDLIHRADIGLLPFHACPHINSTVANKLFEYMALALPVVVSDVPPMVRVLEETDAGLTFRSGDAQDLARAIESLAMAPERARKYGEAGRKAVRTRYHWGVDEVRLLAAIHRP
jgi:glycosyltransferase involved in cell wall biosynthesis